MLALPDGFDRQAFEKLLASWQVDEQALRAMEDIAAGLRRHSRYDRTEPVGPWAQALQNFLFATADRRGYCMHSPRLPH